MRPSRKLIRNSVGTLIILCVAVFFYRAFRENWATLKAQKFQPEYLSLGASGATIIVLYLLSTCCWQLTINALTGPRKLKFVESIAALNSSGITKYIPGKVWAYALQMYWLDAAQVRPSVIVYANLSNMAISLATSVLTGLALLAFAAPPPLFWPVVAVLAFLLVVDVLAIVFHSRALRTVVPWVRRLLRREVQDVDVPVRLLVDLHVLHFVGALLSVFCIYLMCLGVGYSPGRDEASFVIASALLADVAGSLALIVPGGLGVKEGVMYLLLKGASSDLFALVLPIASRVIGMIVDLLMGSVAILLLRQINAGAALEHAPEQR